MEDKLIKKRPFPFFDSKTQKYIESKRMMGSSDDDFINQHDMHLPPKKRVKPQPAKEDAKTEDKLMKGSEDFVNQPAEDDVKTEDKVKVENSKQLMVFGVDLLAPPTPTPTERLFDHIFAKSEGEVISDKHLIMERPLTHSDISSGQARLAIPRGKVEGKAFLRENEVTELKNNGMMVNVIGSKSLRQYEIAFCRWYSAERMNKKGEKNRSFKYVLKKPWTTFKTENEFEEGQKIQLWSYRCNGRLCFAVVGLEIVKEKKTKKEKTTKTKKEKKSKTKREKKHGKKDEKEEEKENYSIPDPKLAQGFRWLKTGPRSCRVPV